MAEEQRDKDRRIELASQDSVEIAVASRNLQISNGANPDPNVGTGFYGGEEVAPVEKAKPKRRRSVRRKRAS